MASTLGLWRAKKCCLRIYCEQKACQSSSCSTNNQPVSELEKLKTLSVLCFPLLLQLCLAIYLSIALYGYLVTLNIIPSLFFE